MAYPIKISWKTEILPILMLAAGVGLAGYFYNHFPEMVASHWNFRGEIDSYANKTQGAWAIPVILIALYGMFWGLPLIDPKRERYADFARAYLIMRDMILGLLLFVYTIAGLSNLGFPVKVGNITAFAVGLLMIVLGNYMGKLKKNWFVGIKTPWTLSSDNVWNRTHRAGGWFFVVFGIIIILVPYLPETIGMIMFTGGAIMVTAGSMGYSYWVYRQEQKDLA